jgi:hypothetical protein
VLIKKFNRALPLNPPSSHWLFQTTTYPPQAYSSALEMTRSISLIPCLVYLLVGYSTGHFLLNYPTTIGFGDDLEGTPPCGGFEVNFSTDNVTDFHVGGDALAVTSIHPQATWLFRATLDQTASGNWTDLLPAVEQTGLGQFCEPDVTVSSSFAGSKGVIQVVQDALDGILYQVSGQVCPEYFSSCTNTGSIVCSCQLRRRVQRCS